MSRDNIPPGSWGGDFGSDPLGNEYRIKQARRFDQIHDQEEARIKANAGKLIVKKRQGQHEINNDQQSIDDEIYANINQAGPGDGSEDAWIQKKQSDVRWTDLNGSEFNGSDDHQIKKSKKIIRKRHSPEFQAGQAIFWMSTLRDLAENNLINHSTIIEAMKTASELQYVLAEALDNSE